MGYTHDAMIQRMVSERVVHPYRNAAKLPTEGPIDTRGLTQAGQRLEIEIGPGRGSFIVERAQETQDVALVGLEIKYKWAYLVDERLSKRGFGNRARVYAADARDILSRLVPDASVHRFYLHFPDPWWKKRQQKRQVITLQLLQDIERLLVPQGTLFIQTDVMDRADHYEALAHSIRGLVPDGDEQGSARLSQPRWGARSNRERRVIEEGLTPARFQFRKPPA